jgi:hypothetical protein
MKTRNKVLLIIGIVLALLLICGAIYFGCQNIKGIQGEQGIKGDKGDKGDKGINGNEGDEGDKGKTGASGSTGATGAPGESITVNPNKTIIAGIISLNKLGGTPLSDVDVFVSCNSNLKYAITEEDGSYGVSFSQDICNVEDNVIVLASKGNLTGKGNETVINDSRNPPLDFAIVNVYLI